MRQCVHDSIGLEVVVLVSIQLISPASGENREQLREKEALIGFHSINFPSEWGVAVKRRPDQNYQLVSIQLISPASGEKEIIRKYKPTPVMFPFN